jgi:outer membrane protein
MTRQLLRSLVAIVLAGVTTLAPVSPTFGQAQAPATAQDQTPATPAVAVPGQQPTQTPVVPVPVVPFQFASGRNYSLPPSWFPHVLRPYQPTQVSEPQFTNSPKIDQLIKDGKLMLSLQDAVELALENNLDLQVQRYNPWIAETDILRTMGGGADRGTAGNTTLPGAFTDQNPVSFDPLVTTGLSADSRQIPVNNPLIAGTGGSSSFGAFATLFTHTEIGDFGYSQTLHYGTSFAMSLDTTRISTTSSAVAFNPSVQTTGQFAISQPLLNGFGRAVNERYLRIARLNKKANDEAFTQSIITDITAVEDDYWELVFARGNVTVQQQAVDLAQRLYEDNKKQVEVGTLAQLGIVQAQAQVATAQQALIVAQTAQLQEQTLLMSVITKNPTAQNLLNVEIVPTDSVQSLPPVENLTLQDAVNEALAKRPDVAEAKLTINADGINIQATHNALLPQLTVSVFASSVGLGGNRKVTTPVPAVVPGGIGSALSQVLQGSYPEYEAQLALSLPLRNRVAAADNARALLAERQDQTRLQLTINNAMVDVQNALIALQQDGPTVTAAQTTRLLQQETLDAEQKKLDLGASTIFLVVTDQQTLAAAAAAEVRAEANLAEAVVNLQRALGRTLEAFKITVADAQSGSAPHETNIPGTTMTGQLIDRRLPN